MVVIYETLPGAYRGYQYLDSRSARSLEWQSLLFGLSNEVSLVSVEMQMRMVVMFVHVPLTSSKPIERMRCQEQILG